MPDIPGTIDYLTLVLRAIADGRVEARTLLDMTPEQREEYKQRLIAEERAEIERGLARHEPAPE